MLNFKNTFDRLLAEATDDIKKVGIFPGAFKPPHVGHYTTALNACNMCDEVYIYVSSKSRELSTQNVSTAGKGDDSSRYNNLLETDKFTNNLLGVQRADVARMTSASAMRAAISIKDKNTIIKNLPEGSDYDTIFRVLMQSNNIDQPDYGHITSKQALQIWNLYRPMLVNNSRIQDKDLHIIESPGSPVRDTYELVDSINNSEWASHTSVYLFVGT